MCVKKGDRHLKWYNHCIAETQRILNLSMKPKCRKLLIQNLYRFIVFSFFPSIYISNTYNLDIYNAIKSIKCDFFRCLFNFDFIYYLKFIFIAFYNFDSLIFFSSVYLLLFFFSSSSFICCIDIIKPLGVLLTHNLNKMSRVASLV